MSILLFSIGALAVIAGTAMVGFGLPVAEFSFGNTLIIAGSTTAVGGLVVIGLGAVVSKLQQITDSLAAGPVRPVEAFDTGLHGAPGRVPVRPKAKGDGGRQAPEVRQIPPTQAVRAVDEPLPPPTLRNPELPPVPSEDEVSLSPRYPSGSDPDVRDLGAPARPAPPEPSVQAPKEPRIERPRRPLATPTRSGGGYFDAVWPRKSARTPASEAPAELPVDQPLPDPRAELPRADTARSDSLRAGARPDSPRHDAASADQARDLPRPDLTRPDRDVELPREPEPHAAGARTDIPAADADRTDRVGSDPERTAGEENAPGSERREEASKTPAVLKSGVVDGMGYTLYVDGSIEAELPEGTLRFASINELRSHLEKNA